MVFIFDYDGVIANSSEVARVTYNELSKEYDYPEVDQNGWDDLFTGNFFENFKKVSPTVDLQKYSKDFFGILEKKETPIFNGMRDIIVPLQKEIYIVSSSHSDNIRLNLEKNDITVQNILGADINTSKVAKFEFIKEKHEGEDIIFITDTTGDIKEAREVQIPVIAVSWGYHAKEDLEKLSPEYMVQSPAELNKLLVKLS